LFPQKRKENPNYGENIGPSPDGPPAAPVDKAWQWELSITNIGSLAYCYRMLSENGKLDWPPDFYTVENGLFPG
jgi:hypothetical protein